MTGQPFAIAARLPLEGRQAAVATTYRLRLQGPRDALGRCALSIALERERGVVDPSVVADTLADHAGTDWEQVLGEALAFIVAFDRGELLGADLAVALGVTP